MARTDLLTGLLNRRSFESVFQTENSRVSRSGGLLCLAMCDIDGFKKINDTLGHMAGDRMLKCVADAFLERKRGQDYVFRWGGDEFLLLMPDTSLEGAETFVSGVMELLSNAHCKEDGKKLPNAGISFGITLYMKDESVENTIRRCDMLLYKAKTQKGPHIEKG
ncbi:MAG: GGDEF domain-containing protein [Synergistota bacterium]|nr:GGDEF domain-containing protein [Synergistota bacterium]